MRTATPGKSKANIFVEPSIISQITSDFTLFKPYQMKNDEYTSARGDMEDG